eukprot:13286794-Alexandrium_andersonii.AAC.1
MLSRGEGRLARRPSWDRELPGWTLRPGPILTRGLMDGIGAGAYESASPQRAPCSGGTSRASATTATT